MHTNKKNIVAFILTISMGLTYGVSCKETPRTPEKFSINGVDIQNYTIVYDNEDIFSKYCAENLYEVLLDLLGVEMQVVSDEAQEETNEILIGKTNRAPSIEAETITLDNDEYLFGVENGKIVLCGEGYMVGGAANHLVNGCIIPAKTANQTEISYQESAIPYTYAYRTPQNVILMIGDGMGDNHIQAAEFEKAIPQFYPLSMPNQGKATTFSYSVYCVEAKSTDSAAAATALATGYKTNNRTIGLDHAQNKVKNVRELAREKGAKTAILTTDVITGATPAAFTTHCADRGDFSIIQTQTNSLFWSGDLSVALGSLGDTLLDKTAATLYKISAQNSKFFAMIEEGYIDKHSHNNDKAAMFNALQRFNNTVAYVMEFVLLHPDTALIVTADHETGGLTKDGENGYVYTSTGHTNENVSVFAMGLGTEKLTGVIDNTDIAKYIAALYGDNHFGGEKLTLSAS